MEDIEQEIAEQAAADDAAEKSEEQRRRRRAAHPRRNLGALPAHLPRDEVVIDIDSKECPCCGGALHLIDETRTEMLDRVPAQLRVKVIRRPRYGCRACGEAVVQAPAPERPIDGGMATEALLAQIVIGKFCDFLPLYRQAEMLKREGITIDRSTLGDWVGRACWWLRPLYDLVVSTVLSSPKVFADDTTLPVLDPGRGKTKTGRLWCYAVDDRPWKGPTHPAAAYIYSEDRKATHPTAHLVNFRGVLQVDGYNGFGSLVTGRGDGSIQLAFCWAHTRRPFYEFYVSNKSPLAAEALARIGKLYEIEAEIRGHPAEHRRAVRQQRSRPIVEALHVWLQEQLPRLSGSSASGRCHALCPASLVRTDVVPRRWPHRARYQRRRTRHAACDVGTEERLVRGQRRGRRAVGDCHDADHTAKLNGVEPLAWLTDVLERLVSGRTKQHEIEQLLPWNWRPPGAVPLAEAA